MPDFKPLIHYIVDRVNEQGGSVGRTALMKLVYLVDVEHYRQYGKQATGLKWRFHHYGPYADELQADVLSLGLDADEDIFSGKDWKSYSVRATATAEPATGGESQASSIRVTMRR